MEYFKKPSINLSGKELIAVFTAFNECERIPFFLSYYRRMGVQHFLAIDNNSTDYTKELLVGQNDVTYFHTKKSYISSKAGRLWTSELADYYCIDKWCLTIDLDEQLVFPGCEFLTLIDMCEYLDDQACYGLFCVFLDMYHAGPLSEAIYTPGQPFLDVCDHFETAGYTLRQPLHFPHVQVSGGPRQRIFWQGGTKGNGPSMRKVPLVKWRKGFSYVFSTHSTRPIQLASVTGALLHFKFFSTFKSFAEQELARGDRVQMSDYQKYTQLTREKDINFYTAKSIKYQTSNTLVESGVMVSNQTYLKWMNQRFGQSMSKIPRRNIKEKYVRELRHAMKEAYRNAVLTLPQLPAIWTLLTDTTNAEIFWVRDYTIGGCFVDLREDEMVATIEARLDNEVVATAEVGKVHWPHAMIKDHGKLHYACFELTVPKSVFASRREHVQIDLMAKDTGLPFAFVTLYERPKMRRGMSYDGVCHDNDTGRLRGWIWRPEHPSDRVSISVHIDGKFWRNVVADDYRQDLVDRGVGDGSYGFGIDLPDWLDPSVDYRINIVVHGTNLPLRRSPLRVLGSNVMRVVDAPLPLGQETKFRAQKMAI